MNKKNNKDLHDDEDELHDDDQELHNEHEEDFDDENFDDGSEEEEEFKQHSGFDTKKKIIAGAIVAITIVAIYKIFFSGSSIEEAENIIENVGIKEKNIIQMKPEEVIDEQVTQIEEEQIIEIRNEDVLQTNNDLVNLPDFNKLELPDIPDPIIEVQKTPEAKTIEPDLPMMDLPQMPQFNQGNQSELPPIEPPSLGAAKTRGASILAFGGSADSNKQNNDGSGNLRDIASNGDVDGALNLFDQITGRYNKGEGFATEHDSPQTSAVPRIAATYYGDRNYMITQGKIFDAVLETAIDSSEGSSGNQGMLRAIITRDVYSDGGYNVLLPRGTRLIGVYDSNNQNSGRVNIMWSRAIRPDGIDIAINSPGVDLIGRNGIKGMEDTKFINLIKNAILISGVTIGAGIVGQSIASEEDAEISTVKDADGNISESGTIVDFAIRDAVKNVEDIFKNYIERHSDTATRVYVHQGTPLKVFVTSDLIFAKSVSGLVREINKVNKIK